jgi:DNA repair exonuclease SbcCD ATPase subunit
MRRGAVWTLVAISLALAVGCARAPSNDLAAVEDTLMEAEEAEAATYAPDTWSKAIQEKDAAVAEIARQSRRFAPLRSYATARRLLAGAQEDASQALQEAQAGRHEAESRAREAYTELTSLMTQAEAALTRLERCRARGLADRVSTAHEALAALQGELDEYEDDMAAERFSDAFSVADAASDTAAALVSELEAATKAHGC